MIVEQCSIDVFLIDWENPRPSKKNDVVSVWRMYFVANEWNELQVARKSSMPLQITLVLFILCVSTNGGHSRNKINLIERLCNIL